jgi:hypothetical protein
MSPAQEQNEDCPHCPATEIIEHAVSYCRCIVANATELQRKIKTDTVMTIIKCPYHSLCFLSQQEKEQVE